MKTANTGVQDLFLGDNQKKSRKSEEHKRRTKKPEIQRYIPKGRLLEQQQDSREGSTDWEGDISSPSPNVSQTPSPAPGNLPLTPSPRKIDRNLQVTVVNDKAAVKNMPSVTSEKSAELTVGKSGENTSVPKGRGQGSQSYSRGRGQRLSQRSNRQNESKGMVGNIANMTSPKVADSQEQMKEANKDKDVKQEQDLYIVPSRPSTIGQEADRKDTVPVGTEKNETNTREQSHYTRSDSAPLQDKQNILNRFRRTPSKSKSRSYDKLNKSERWDEEEGFYADPGNLGTMVFERSHSSEQLNLSARNTGKPPMPRSTSGGTRGGQRKYPMPGMRKRTDSISSDLSAGKMWEKNCGFDSLNIHYSILSFYI